ncbi:MAG TPA: hypothetical protein VMM12_00770 [Longimicrobiales bacterium]|nr:hypothetical protein [Longimicrobiales bacterium]
MKRWLVLATALAAGGCGGGPAPSSYAGDESREIKALDDAEVAGLLAGEGLGFARAAERNGFPGPRHVLDAAAELELTDDQRARVQAIFDRMSAEAVRLGRELVEGERTLDSLFAAGAAAPPAVAPPAVAERAVALGTLRGRLRNVHLQAHLETAPLLTEGQRMRYREVRGYDAAPGGGPTTDPDHAGHAGH